MVASYIKEFMFNTKEFVNFIDYFENRLKRRLINVYKRYEIDNRKFSCQWLSISMKIMDDYLYECKKRGHEIEWIYEGIYNF